MDRLEEPSASSPSGETKVRTPAYRSFESSSDKLLHLMKFILFGIQRFNDELDTKLWPDAMNLLTEIAQVDRAQKISDTLVEPLKQFTGGLLTAHEWIPVLLVTMVEAYLKDVLIYAAKVDAAIMESSRLTVPYAEVVRARSLEELKEKLPPRWAGKFLDDHRGPDSWIKKLTKMGARGYRPETAKQMETLWGVRHLLVHSAGVATAEFVRRHPEIGAKIGERSLIRSDQLSAWFSVVPHFVDVTDFYFVQRYGLGTVSTT